MKAAVVALLMSSPLSAALPAIAAMKWHDRVLLVAAPRADDPMLAEQRRILDRWRSGAADRDLRLVVLAGARVEGAADTPAALAAKHHLPAGRFTAILIGKDGGEKLRADKPFSAETLRKTIDAMPMRRAGQR